MHRYFNQCIIWNFSSFSWWFKMIILNNIFRFIQGYGRIVQRSIFFTKWKNYLILSLLDSYFLAVHNLRFSLHKRNRDQVCIWSLSLHEFDGLILIESDLAQMIKVVVMMFMGNLIGQWTKHHAPQELYRVMYFNVNNCENFKALHVVHKHQIYSRLNWERYRCNTDCKNDPANCISADLFLEMGK